MRARFLGVIGVCLLAAGCDFLAVETAPRKQPSVARTAAALQADQVFWDTLHGGQYGRISAALDALKAAYLADPRDAVTAAHIGWLHIWRLSERGRSPSVTPGITDDAVMARKYFEEAVALDPGEARYLGFLASALLAEGTIHQDEKLRRRGYFLLMDGVKAWPEFNLFTAGYVLSRQPADSPRFREGLDYIWRNLDVCVGEKVSREVEGWAKYMALQTTEGKKRACWNTPIAPHNFEGFFLNMGDMLVKAGEWQKAQKVYATAKLASDYAGWRYRDVLEARIREAQRNVALFNSPEGQTMVQSPFACMACHQK